MAIPSDITVHEKVMLKFSNVDNRVTLFVNDVQVKTYSAGKPKLDITSYLENGSNDLRVMAYNISGPGALVGEITVDGQSVGDWDESTQKGGAFYDETITINYQPFTIELHATGSVILNFNIINDAVTVKLNGELVQDPNDLPADPTKTYGVHIHSLSDRDKIKKLDITPKLVVGDNNMLRVTAENATTPGGTYVASGSLAGSITAGPKAKSIHDWNVNEGHHHEEPVFLDQIIKLIYSK